MTKPSTILPGSGISLNPSHYELLLEQKPDISFLEIHPENYMVDGGLQLYYLEKLRELYPISMHGVGMSLGSAEGIDDTHLNKLSQLVKDYSPSLVSEHLSWSHGQGIYFNDLLPLPYTAESLQTLKSNIHKVQDKLQRNILIENPSTYIEFNSDEFSEQDFLKQLCDQTGCKLLLDVNNVFVSTSNHQQDPSSYLDSYPFKHVEEIHLAGHSIYPLIEGKVIRIDNHGSQVCNEVWQLLNKSLHQMGKPTALLIEWDTDIPELELLLQEADKAKQIQNQVLP